MIFLASRYDELCMFVSNTNNTSYYFNEQKQSSSIKTKFLVRNNWYINSKNWD